MSTLVRSLVQGKGEKCYELFWPLLKILYWADFDLLESIFIYIFVNEIRKNYHGTFFLLSQVLPPCVLKIFKR